MSLAGHPGENPNRPNFRKDSQEFSSYLNKLEAHPDEDRVLQEVRRIVIDLFRLPRTKQDQIHGQAFARVLETSDDQVILYYTAASVCNVADPRCLRLIYDRPKARSRIWDSLCRAVEDETRQRESNASPEELREAEKRVVVLGAALVHLYFSVGSWDKLITLVKTGDNPTSPQTPKADGQSQLVNALRRLWLIQTESFGAQPPVFTSASLTAGLLLGVLDPSSSVFYQENGPLAYRLNSASSPNPASWNQLALFTLACNTHGGLKTDKSIAEYFEDIKTVYNTTRPSPELSTAIFRALRSHTRETTRLPSTVFKLAWKLYVCGNDGVDEAQANHALGQHVPFLGILEAKVRDDEMPEGYKEYFRVLRKECFEVVLDGVRTVPPEDQTEELVHWRFRAVFVFKVVEHYASCIMTLGEAQHPDNEESLRLVRLARSLASAHPASNANPDDQSLRSYQFDLNIFERTCERFESFVTGS